MKISVWLTLLLCVATAGTSAEAQTSSGALPVSQPPAKDFCPEGMSTWICYQSLAEAESAMRAATPDVGAFLYRQATEAKDDLTYLRYAVRPRAPSQIADPAYSLNIPGGLVLGESYCPGSIATDAPRTESGFLRCHSETEMIEGFISSFVQPGTWFAIGLNNCVNSAPYVSGAYISPFAKTTGTVMVQSTQSHTKFVNWTETCYYRGAPTAVQRSTEIHKIQSYKCPTGYNGFETTDTSLYLFLCRSGANQTIRIRGQKQRPTCSVGHPCHPGNGDKSRAEPDFVFAGRPFVRHYHSLRRAGIYGGNMGPGWTHSFSATIGNEYFSRIMVGGDGQIYDYAPNNGNGYYFPSLAGAFLTADTGHYVIKEPTGQVSTFSYNGQLVSVVDLKDPKKNVFLSYDGNSGNSRLSKIHDSSGRYIQFIYSNDSFISKIILPDGKEIIYNYDQNDNLSSVDYGNGQLKKYLYGEAGLAPNGDMGLLTGIISEDGVRYGTFGYDEYGRVISSELSGPGSEIERTQLSYPSDSQAVVKEMNGALHYYTFIDNFGRKAASITKGGSTEYFSYGNFGVLSTRLDGRENRSEYFYDHLGRIVREIGAANATDGSRRTIENTWNTSTNRIATSSIKDASGTVVSKVNWTYNVRGQTLTQQAEDPATSTTSTQATTYCEDAQSCGVAGFPLVIDGPRSDVDDKVRLTYYLSDDPACASTPANCLYRKGDLWKVTNANGHVIETLAYDGAGRPLSVKDSNGTLTEYEYSPRGWLLRQHVGAGGTGSNRVTEFEYWPTGLAKGVTMPDGSYTGYTYDAAHRLTDILDGDGNRIHLTYDPGGNRVKEETFGTGNTLKRNMSRAYDTLGRLASEKNSHGLGSTYTYDANRNATGVVDAAQVTYSASFDALNRLTQSIQDVGGIAASTQFKYDALDNLTEVTDPKGLKTTYTYDGLGQMRTTTSPDTGTTQRTYDEAGNLKTSTDARGVTTTYAYDALNRMTSKIYPSQGEDVSYTYDTVPAACAAGEVFSIGRLSSMADASGRTDYCYNRFGDVVRKAQITNGKTFVVRYTYTIGGNLASVIYPDGAVADYIRDGQGRITEVGVTSGSSGRQVLLTAASYLPFGPSTGWQYGNGRALVRSFDTDYRPTAVVDSGNDLKIGLGYDSVSNITALESGNYAAALNYDNLGRLTEFRDSAANVAIEHYTYDATGNRLSFANAGATTPYGYDATSHRLTSVGSFSRSYDAVGNSISVLSGAKSYAYNQANRLSQVKLGTATVQNYAYNARGERVQRGLDTTSSTYTTYDEAGHWLGDYDSLGNATQQVVWMDDMPVGLLADGVLHYIEPDHLGTPRLVLNPLRNVPVWTWDIKGEAFGGSVPNQDPDSDGQAFVFDMRFPGQRYDAVSGLNYNYFRDYDPANGRYAQSDPIGLAGGISSYGYVGGDPIGGSDSLGLACDSRGCWNTPEEVRFAIAGDWKGYYAAACAGGDPYACRGHEVATNTGEGLRGALSFLTNKKLAASILQNQPIGCPMSVRTDMLNSNMESIRKGLVLARVDQLATATIQNPIMVTRQSISNFHQSVFTRNGASANAFGGDLWDIIKPVSTFFYDWCGAPACQ